MKMVRIYTASIYSILVGLLASQPLEYFYTENTITGESLLEGGCIKRDWEGKDPEGLMGHPWISNIQCMEGTKFLTAGLNFGGPVQIWVESGSMDVNGKVLDVIGSSIWINIGSPLNVNVTAQSSIWVVGAPLDVRDVEIVRFVNYG